MFLEEKKILKKKLFGNRDKKDEPIFSVMKGLAVLLVLIMAVMPTNAEYPSDVPSSGRGPHLTVSSLSGSLEEGRPSMITIQICNDAHSNASAGEDNLSIPGIVEQEAMGTTADLRSQEEGIRVLSSPQPAGSLAPGENRSVEFLVLAREGAGSGVHPLSLMLNYSYLYSTAVTGDEQMPDVAFLYRDDSLTVPLEVRAVLGPSVEIKEVQDRVVPNQDSEIIVTFANRGDAPAENLSAEILPQEPFDCVACLEALGSLSPGDTAEGKFRLLAKNASTGNYALPCRLSYTHAGEMRDDELAVLVELRGQSWIESVKSVTFPAAALILIMLLAFGIYLAIGKNKKRRPRRWR